MSLVHIAWGLGISMAVSWLVLLAVLIVVARRQGVAEICRLPILMFSVVRLLKRLIRDPRLPMGARVRLLTAFVYCVQPVNLIPDFVPVVGFADNVAVAVWALRSVVRLSGPELLTEHWPAERSQLRVLRRALRI